MNDETAEPTGKDGASDVVRLVRAHLTGNDAGGVQLIEALYFDRERAVMALAAAAGMYAAVIKELAKGDLSQALHLLDVVMRQAHDADWSIPK